MEINIKYSGKSTKYPYEIEWEKLYNHPKLKEYFLSDVLPLAISLSVYRKMKTINNEPNMAILEMSESKKANANPVDEWSKSQLCKLLLYIKDLKYTFQD